MHRHCVISILFSAIACLVACQEAHPPPQPTVVIIPAPPPVTTKVRVAERPAPPAPTVTVAVPPAPTAAEDVAATEARTCAWFVDDDPMAYPNELLAKLAAKRLGHSLNDVKTACVPCPFEDCP